MCERRAALLLLGLSVMPSSVRAQAAVTPPVVTAAGQSVAAPAAAPAEAATPESYSYEPSGRRDPFLNLIGFTEVQPQAGPIKHVDGAAGLSVSEATVRGVMKSGGALIALVQGSDKRTYVVHQGDKLLDGTIKAVVPDGLVILQAVNDPLSLLKQREVRKLLRSVEGGKQ